MIKSGKSLISMIFIILILSNFSYAQGDVFSFAKQSIKVKAEDVARQIDLYLELHPDMTVEDLQNDPEFQKIAVQQVGQTGYTAVTDYDTLICRFHQNPTIVNLKLEELSSKLPGFWEIMSKTKGGVENEGIYDWEEADGSIKQKYMYIALVERRTADGVGLHVAATTYLEEYLVFEEEENQFFWFYIMLGLLIFFIFGLWFFQKNEETKVRTYSIKKKLILSFSVLIVLMMVLVFLNYSFDQVVIKNTEMIRDVEAPLELMVEQVIGYDAMLTGYAHTSLLHALKGEKEMIKEHKDDYDKIGFLMDNLLKNDAPFLLEQSGRSEEQKKLVRSYLKRLDELNIALVELELKAFEIMESDPYRAYDLLMGEEYHEYKEGLSEIYYRWSNLEAEVTAGYRAEIIRNTKFLNIINIVLPLFIIFLGILIIILMLNSIMRPIRALYASIIELQKGNFKTKVDIKSGDELEVLGNVFNKTVKTLSSIEEEHNELEKAKTEFLSITSHELRSPMTPMRAQLQMLMKGYYGKLNEKQKESMNIVLRNTERLDKILVDFLEVSRIEAARLKFRFMRTNLEEYIKRTVEETKHYMPEKNIKFILKMDKLPIFEVDPDRVMQVLRNLLNNAVKFCDDGGKIKIRVKLKKDHIFFSVRDNGVGISQEDQKRLFEPFFQAGGMYQRRVGGTGLGLAICKGIVESQNGMIGVKSKKGKGSKFYFTVPLKPVKKIKPIRLLFSGSFSIKNKLKGVFKEILGPIGAREFEDFIKNNKLEKDNIFKYIDSLINNKIIGFEESIIFKVKVSRIFGEEYKPDITSKKIMKWIREK